MVICCSYLLWPFAVAIAVAICRGNLPWLFVVGLFCKSFFLCEQVLFLCKQIFFNWKQIFFICEQIDQVYSNTRVTTQVNTSQHESKRVWHESTLINTSQHKSDMSQYVSNTGQHESDTGQHESTQVKKCPRWVNMSQHKSDTSQLK